jgi:chromatin remodeling complex protein RSC6
MYNYKMPPKSSQSKAKAKSQTKSGSNKSKSTQESAPATTEPEPAPAPAPAPEPEPAPVVESNTSVSTESSEQPTLDAQFNSINVKLQTLKSLEVDIMNDLRRLQKTVTRHLKDVNKRNKRKKVSDEDKKKRAPSGFAKPTIISDQLCDFLGKAHGTEMARTEVTKELTKYIKKFNLQDEKDRRKILPDAKLKNLLNVESGQEVTYFNLQKYMKVHFPKPASATVVV